MGKATGTNKAKVQDAYAGKLKLKVSPKGAVQLNGLRRFPVTLYREEWEAVLSRADAIRGFIEANAKDLKTKTESGGEDDGAGDTI